MSCYHSPPLSRFPFASIEPYDLLINPDLEKSANVRERRNLYSSVTDVYATFLPKELIENLCLDTYVGSLEGKWFNYIGLAYISCVLPPFQRKEIKKIADMGINVELDDISESLKFCAC